MRSVFLAAAAGLAMLLPAPSARAADPAPPRPKLLVVISVDQFAWELNQRYLPTFSGGLKRLSGGVSFTGYQSHAATETCPGHSTILTGDHPARTGIVANNWYDRRTGSNVYCVSKLGVADPSAKTSELLRVDTLGDWLRAATPASRSIAVSGKDRAAIMMGGHHPSAVYWWEDGAGFTTSKYAGPADAATLAPAKAFDARLFAAWRAKPPALWPAEISPACHALEKPYAFGRLKLSGKAPPESATGVEADPNWLTTPDFAAELRASPSFDPLALQFAGELAAAQNRGAGPAVDLLAVSLSSTDHVGHRYGGGGAEMCVQMAALDAALGDFLAGLDKLNAPYLVVLTADHGAIDAAERLGPPAARLDVAAVLAGLNTHLRKTFGFAYDPLAGDDPRQLFFSLPPADDVRRAEVVQAAQAWLRGRPEVADVFTADEVAAAAPPPGKPPTDLSMAERFHESFDRDRSGDLLVGYAKGATLGLPAGPGSNVAGHGSPWDYDRRVPVLVCRDRRHRPHPRRLRRPAGAGGGRLLPRPRPGLPFAAAVGAVASSSLPLEGRGDHAEHGGWGSASVACVIDADRTETA